MASAPVVRCLHSAMVVAALAIGCREQTPPATTPSAMPAQSESRSTPESVSTALPVESEAAERHLSEDEIVAVLVDSKFQGSTTEGAKESLVSVGEIRESHPIEDAVELRASATDAHFLVTYVRDERGGWKFSYAQATRNVPDVNAAAESYKQFEGKLRARFGKPAWVQSAGGPPPSKGWNIGNSAIEVSLLQRLDERGNVLIELNLAEPQGEAD